MCLDMQFHLRSSNKHTDRKGDKYRVVNCYPNKDPKKIKPKGINLFLLICLNLLIDLIPNNIGMIAA